MNVNSKQVTLIDATRMDTTTVLGFYGQIKNIIAANSGLTSNLSTVWTAFTSAYNAFDDAYAQVRRWQQTEDISNYDTARDEALSAFLNMLKALQTSPNTAKQQAAKRLLFIRDKYNLSASDEYMKETTAVAQMVQEMEATQQATDDLTATGLDDWFTDLKTKNEAFLAKMNERTEAQAGMEKGIVRDRRLKAEAAYKDVVKLINALAIVEFPEGFDYTRPIDLLNAEIEHYRQILARKGVSTGSSSNNNSGGSSTPSTPSNGNDEPGGDPSTGSGTEEPDPNTGGGETPDPNTGGGDTPGGDTPGGNGGDNGGNGGGNSGGGDTGGIGGGSE